MNIGDKVRLLHGNEEGHITKIMPGNMIEIEIEDGFRIPVMRSEIVMVAKEEDIFFGSKQQSTHTSTIKTHAFSGPEAILVAFKAYRDDLFDVYLINQTQSTLVYSISETSGILQTGIAVGTLEPGKHAKFTDRSPADFERWPELLFRIIRHKNEAHQGLPFIEKVLKIKAPNFHKAKKACPPLGGDAHVFQLDDHSLPIDVQKLKENMTEKNDPIEQKIALKPESVVDLHIENLVNDYDKLDNSNILDIQLKTFESKLDQAIASGIDQITFVHGVGNGVLRNAIQKRLSTMKNISFFADTQKEKFGYGATQVVIKT